MDLKSPSTYGEWYWAHGLQAQKDMDEQTEFALAPFFGGVIADITDISAVPSGVAAMLSVLAAPPSAGLGGFAALTAGEFASETIRDLIKPGMSAAARKINRGALETWLTASQGTALNLRGKIDDEYYNLVMASEGYGPSIAGQFKTAMTPYPTIPEIMRFARYHGDPENTKEEVWKRFNVPVDDYDVHEWLTLQVLSTDQVHKLFRRETITEDQANMMFHQIGYRADDVEHIKQSGWIVPNPMLIAQGKLHQGIEKERLLEAIQKADIHPDHTETYYDAILTKPPTLDVVAFELRQANDLYDLPESLGKIGIHPDYFELYKELSNVIPPVSDIITMAVREVFTPAIAARFGQYEDFPDPLEEWAGKKGLSREWAERYWAAHWSLPSATQGFQMLHRGVIDQDDLNMLLRAQDVMPFWRDKLTQIAYRPLTRVDVRRMYKENVLDADGVYEAYLEHGYNQDKARKMTEFTVKQALTAQAKFTSRDVIAAFTKRMINTSDARSLLIDLGIDSNDVSYILSRAEYKRLWDMKEDRIAGIRNLYKKGVYDADAAKGKLLQLNLPSDEVDLLFEKWWYEKQGDLAPTFTKAETIRFVKNNKLTLKEARSELDRMGYDKKHIDIYLDFSE